MQHELVEPRDPDLHAAVLEQRRLSLGRRRRTLAVTPHHAAGDIARIQTNQHVHQTTVVPAVAHDDRSEVLEQLLQSVLPSQLHIRHTDRIIDRVKEQVPVDLGNQGAPQLRPHKPCQRFMGHHER